MTPTDCCLVQEGECESITTPTVLPQSGGKTDHKLVLGTLATTSGQYGQGEDGGITREERQIYTKH